MLPGEPETRLEQERRRTGLRYHAKEFAALNAEAAKAGLPSLAAIEKE
jgi:hypothetical protein